MIKSGWGRVQRHKFGATLGIILALVLLSGFGAPILPDGCQPTKETCKSCIEEDCPPLVDCIEDACNDEGGGAASSSSSNAIFEPNLGQPNLAVAGAPYGFVSHQGQNSVFLSGDGIVAKLGKSTLKASIAGGRAGVSPEPLELQAERVNYLIGNQQEKWVTNIPTYGRVRYSNVYPGIDVAYYGTGQKLEHDFIVSPGANPAAIQLQFEGADQMEADGDGGIQLRVGSQKVYWQKPVIYQTTATGRRQMVEGRYRMGSDRRAGFEIGVYDPTRPVIIDPVIAFTTYYGRGGGEWANRVATDAAGNAYLVGVTNDISFGFTGGAFLGPNSLSAVVGDVLLTKVSADGKTVLYSTHIGGGGAEIGLGIALGSTGNIYITGSTSSTDYPLTTGNFQGQPSLTSTTDPGNCFVTELNAAGNALVFSRLIGGTGVDACAGIGLDSTGNIYIAGGTTSKDLPTQNAFQPGSRVGTTLATIADGFAAKLSPDGTQLLYSTYIGGGGNDTVIGMAVDSAGNAYLTGGPPAMTSPSVMERSKPRTAEAREPS